MDLAALNFSQQRKAAVLGVDLARSQDGDLVLVHGGLVYQSGEAVAVLDISERLKTEKGTEFYDARFGEIVEDWVEDEDTTLNRLEMLMELKKAIQADPRVVDRSAEAEIVSWTQQPRRLKIQGGWLWVTGDKAENLVIQADEDGLKVVQSYNPAVEE